MAVAGALPVARSAERLNNWAVLDPAAEAPTKPAEESPLPLVLRIDKTALTRYSDSDVDRTGEVKKMVLGTYCVGDSHTTGTIRAELLPDSQEAAFDIYFRGRTVTNTKGTQEPGVVWSHTITEFVSKRRVIFDPRKGFVVVGENETTGDTKLGYDRFGSTRQFGHRLITRITEKKSYQIFEQARLIADRDNKKEVAETFSKEVDQQVAEANKGLDLVRYVNGFLGDQKTLQLHAKSTKDFIYIGIGPEGEKYAPMAEMPPSRGTPAPMEIWVHASLLSEPVAALLKLITPDMPIPLLAQTKILSALALPISGSQSAMDVDFHDGWLVLGLPDDGAKAPPPAVAEGAKTEGTTEAKDNGNVAQQAR
ncbi:MAG: hypothetical protein C0483_19180 [Pirellula sp.]|nr:hypothetical protein [Pirellula sp.]